MDGQKIVIKSDILLGHQVISFANGSGGKP